MQTQPGHCSGGARRRESRALRNGLRLQGSVGWARSPDAPDQSKLFYPCQEKNTNNRRLKYYCISSPLESSNMCINKDTDQTNTMILQRNPNVFGEKS